MVWAAWVVWEVWEVSKSVKLTIHPSKNKIMGRANLKGWRDLFLMATIFVNRGKVDAL